MKRTIALTAAAALMVAGSLLTVSAAQADTAPTDPTNPKTPVTVSDDALPTPQIDGVVWTQTIVGNTVFAGGKFLNARPSGAAAGVNTVSRPYLLSYNLTTGVLNSGFAPVLNGQVKAIVGSADGTAIYVSGAFTTVNGVSKSRIVELNATTGAIVSTFNATPNYNTNALALSGNTLFIGGAFSSVGNATRGQIAAVNATTGAVLPFNATAAGGGVTSIAVNPDGSSIVVGGAFTTLDGSSNPGYGMGALNATTGALLPWSINSVIRNAGTSAAVTGLSSDASGVYGSNYVFGSTGNFEGTFHASWTGAIIWIADCHGDEYSTAVTPDAEYVAGHPHVCSTLGGFPQTSPTWTYHRGIAFGKQVTQTLTRSADLHSFAGEPAPSLLDWFPDFNVGTYTGQSQGPWSVAANSQYVVYGGEFTTINGIKQQGLVRFAVPALAPNKMGPTVAAAASAPTLSSVGNTSIKVSWPTNWDPDNQTLTYTVYRNGAALPVYTVKANSTLWQLSTLSFTDTGLSPGTSYSYTVKATDPFGNSVTSTATSAKTTGTAGGGGTTPPATGYAATIKSQGPTDYWRLDQASGTTLTDTMNNANLTAGAGVTGGAAGATGDSDTASNFSGTTTGFASTSTAITGPQTFSIEAWIKTTSTAGGKIIGFGDSSTGTSSKIDRHLYLTTDGKVNFGVHSQANQILTSPTAVNNGAWHLVVGTLGSSGMALYVDGKLVGTNSAVTTAQNYAGYWRVGGDKSWSGAYWFTGTIDDAAVFPTALSAAQVAQEYTASGQ